jgi:hypothetical protein
MYYQLLMRFSLFYPQLSTDEMERQLPHSLRRFFAPPTARRSDLGMLSRSVLQRDAAASVVDIDGSSV